MAEGRRDPQPGDLIEIERTFYDHWAVYVGDGFVIHVTGRACAAWQGADSTSVYAGKAKVMKELLREVVKNDKWHVNNKYDRSRTPRPVKEIIWCAEQWIGKEVPYDVFNRNCEHFVTELLYTVPEVVPGVVVGLGVDGVGGVVGSGPMERQRKKW
ncbi:unnamed protein product [Coccothraustes coccothraustes]